MSDKNIETHFIQDPGKAHTEAKVIQEIGRWGVNNNTVVDQLIASGIKAEYQKAFKDTAKLDLEAQIYEQLKEATPEIVEALEDRIDATAKVAEYLMPQYMDLEHYRPHAAAVKEAATKSQESQDKAWESAAHTAGVVVSEVKRAIQKRTEKGSYPTPYKVFEPVVDEIYEDGIIDRQNDRVLGHVLTAVTAELDLDKLLATKGPAITAAISKVDVKHAYEKQLDYNNNESKAEAKTNEKPA